MHVLFGIAAFAIILMIVLLLLVLFEPPLRYNIKAPDVPLDSKDFLRVIAALSDSTVHYECDIKLLNDGKNFYQAELAAMAQAKLSIHLEAFIFHPSTIGDRFLDVLIERARGGVEVKIVVDAIGSFPTPKRYFAKLKEAGGEVRWYQPLEFATFKHMNNRTHRELIVINGNLGFVGGAGIASHWDIGEKGRPPWRDMMFRVTGGLAQGLQTTFAENWLESSSEILSAVENFPAEVDDKSSDCAGLVVISSPTAGRSTRNRVLFQTLIASAKKTICIHSPYFLPDRSATAELVCAMDRNVSVRIIVPGKMNNHPMTRLASRRRYGPLLQAGVEIYEYQPGMIHTKAMTLDGLWVVVGSTNFDSRSFDLNDEVNLATVNADLAKKVEQEFSLTLSQCNRITYAQWLKRSLLEKVFATIGRIVERNE